MSRPKSSPERAQYRVFDAKRLKRLCFWFSENGGMEDPTQMKILEDALDFYLKEKFPNAEK